MIKNFNGVTGEIILETIMNHSEDTLYFKDIDSKIIVSSKAHCLLWGETDPKKVVGKSDFDYFPHEFAMKAFKDEVEIMKTGVPKTGILERLVRDDGSIIWLSASKYPLYDKKNKIIGTWGTSRNITSLKSAEQELIDLNKKLADANNKLRILSSKDSLSGLFNQGNFYEELNQRFELNKRKLVKESSKGCSLILFDIDDFKNINDIYGHLTGDFTIRYISNLIKENVRVNDLCFRYGGDEFVIILTDTSLEEGKQVAEKLRKIIEKSSVEFMEKDIKITVSMGVSNFNEGKDANEIVKLADTRLYISKEKGKNRVS